mmetsp:Transcript_24353/g.57235  ORF Transcript_24353/g.57235 Transcript_24353/m.57235 type:complete len:388 (+) Transcript_24353:4236-5399(+)
MERINRLTRIGRHDLGGVWKPPGERVVHLDIHEVHPLVVDALQFSLKFKPQNTIGVLDVHAQKLLSFLLVRKEGLGEDAGIRTDFECLIDYVIETWTEHLRPLGPGPCRLFQRHPEVRWLHAMRHPDRRSPHPGVLGVELLVENRNLDASVRDVVKGRNTPQVLLLKIHWQIATNKVSVLLDRQLCVRGRYTGFSAPSDGIHRGLASSQLCLHFMPRGRHVVGLRIRRTRSARRQGGQARWLRELVRRGDWRFCGECWIAADVRELCPLPIGLCLSSSHPARNRFLCHCLRRQWNLQLFARQCTLGHRDDHFLTAGRSEGQLVAGLGTLGNGDDHGVHRWSFQSAGLRQLGDCRWIGLPQPLHLPQVLFHGRCVVQRKEAFVFRSSD